MEISTQEIVNLSDICRACLIKTENMKNLLDANEEIIRLITNLASISNLEIEINESLPCFLCHNCEEKLRIAYDFQQLVQKSYHFILACFSATRTLKVDTVLEPLKLANDSEKSEELPQIEHSSSDLISFVRNDNLETDIQVDFKAYENDLPVDDKSYIVTEEEGIVQANYLETDNIDDKKTIKTEIISCNETRDETEDFIKPLEVERKTRNNQTMRLAQYSVEEVDKLIKKTRERFFKHVSCLYCGFTARYTRSLSVHMTRLHRDLKEQWCLWCNQTYDNIKEHMEVVHKDDLKCPLCGKCSTSTSHFLEHLASHSADRKHVCNICKKCFISSRHLKIHYNVHTDDKPHDKPYSCRECSKGFVLIKSFKTHMKNHKKHRCKVCKTIFDSVKKYNVHKCIVNKNDSEDKGSGLSNADDPTLDNIKITPQNFCEECNKKVRSLQNHKEKYHSNVVREEKKSQGALCTYCGKQFRSIAKLTVHARIHTGEMPYKCSFCDKRTTTRFHMVVHERTHTGEKPHICNICGKAFAQSSVLNTHLKLHTGRPEQCTICMKRFCRNSELRQHMRQHTGEKPYLCAHCGQGFKQRSHLVEHCKTHTDERPYQCEFCEKSFKQAGTLKSHLNIHLDKKPYKCSQCPYACRQSYSLTQHMAQHENDQPKPDRPHRCGICDRSFTTIAMFSSHYVSKHAPVGESHMIADNLAGDIKIQDDGVVLDEFPQ